MTAKEPINTQFSTQKSFQDISCRHVSAKKKTKKTPRHGNVIKRENLECIKSPKRIIWRENSGVKNGRSKQRVELT